ncbi:MAG: TolB family protein [Alphaproteobacteria bacterium]|nr:TolB family protein [Alphaproteobacteria bacterium]
MAIDAPKIESTLEVFHLDAGTREVVHRAARHFEAPNWSRDGKHFLINSEGLLYRLDRDGGEPLRLDTGSLDRLNNDHGLSPDGRLIAVSDKSGPDGKSRIHVLPARGGAARLVTSEGPSYWHGWSPDGRTLAYVAARGGSRDLNIYRCPAEGGAEKRLTAAAGLDDGPDYSCDGRYIYFNSMRSGNMKLWRMHADGSAQEQVTFEDDTRDWFPHPSPDGKWIVFVSFGADVPVRDHPPNKNVTLRLMPAEGGAPCIVANLFGGQGTLNVPSWSPDGKCFAFVGYRLRG